MALQRPSTLEHAGSSGEGRQCHRHSVARTHEGHRGTDSFCFRSGWKLLWNRSLTLSVRVLYVFCCRSAAKCPNYPPQSKTRSCATTEVGASTRNPSPATVRSSRVHGKLRAGTERIAHSSIGVGGEEETGRGMPSTSFSCRNGERKPQNLRTEATR